MSRGPASRVGRAALMPAAMVLFALAVPPHAAFAQTPALPYADVASALADLTARDGAGTIVTRSDDWTIVNEPGAGAQWSFTPKGHPAHPAVLRRVVKRGTGGDVSVETASLCEASAQACAKLLQEFEAMNPRITQAIRARGRQGSAQAAPRAQGPAAAPAPPPGAPPRQP